MSTSPPMVLSATGGMGREATTLYKRLASMLTSRWDQLYNSTLHGLALMQAGLFFTEGCHSVFAVPDLVVNMPLRHNKPWT